MKKTISFVLCIMMTISLLSVTAFAQSGLSNFQKTHTYKNGQFGDVASGDWFSPNVKAAYEYGLILGNTDGSFGADSNVKISEVVAMAARLNSIYTAGSASFTASTPWYQAYVNYAVSNGIITANRFENYDVYATRLQVAEILAAALPASVLSAINTIEIGQIPDVSLETSYTSVYTLYRAGIVTGKTASGNFNPTDMILRSEMAAIVTRMADSSLRVKFTIDKTAAATGAITSAAQLLEAVNNARQSISYASDSYSAAALYYAVPNAELGLAALNSASNYVLIAATQAQNAAAFCKANSKYAAAYDDIYNSYLGCLDANKDIAKVAASPLGASTDWLAAKTLLTGCGEALSRAATAISAVK